MEAFRTVMVTGTMVRAAAELRISQPAVSRLIADLEGELGYQLFLRGGGRLQPTEEARILFGEVQRAFVGLDQVETAARTIGQTVSGTLRLMSMPTLAYNYAVPTVAAFVKDYPDVSVVIETGSRESVLDMINSQRFDIGLATLPVEDPGIVVHKLFDEEWVCILPVGHPLAAQEQIDAKDLSDETFISFSANSFDRLQVDRSFNDAGAPRRLRIEPEPRPLPAIGGERCRRFGGQSVLFAIRATSTPRGA